MISYKAFIGALIAFSSYSAAQSSSTEAATCGVNEGTASFSCHSDCGNAIIYARDTCAYDKDCVCNPDGTFIQNMPACLECGATLWQWYGSYLEPALVLCEMQTTPNGYIPPCPETSTEESSSTASEEIVISSSEISSSEAEISSSDIPASSSEVPASSSDVPASSSEAPVSSSEVSSSAVSSSEIATSSSDIALSSSSENVESSGPTCGVNEGTASFSCHSDCGNAIIYARDTCAYDKDCVCNPDGTFIQNMPACLECGATLWQWYGSYLEPALALCEMQTTPNGYIPPCPETSTEESSSTASEEIVISSSEISSSEAEASSSDVPVSSSEVSISSSDISSSVAVSSSDIPISSTDIAQSSSAAVESTGPTCGVNEGTPSFSCHSDCGNAIIYARDTCAYDKDCVCNPDGTFIQNMPACLECGASLWQWYGSYLEPALALCEMQTTPNGYLPPCPETSESSSSESVGASATDSITDSATDSELDSLISSYIDSIVGSASVTSDGSQAASVTDSSIDSAASSAAVESTGPTCGVNEGTPSFSCHSDCGNAIIYARDTCAYDKDCVCNPDGTFIQNMPACLECGASLWQWYGSYLEPALALCEMQTTPNGYLPPCPETSESSSSESVGASDEITSDGVSQTASVTDLTTDSAASSAAMESTGPTCGVNEGTPSFSCHSDCGNAIIYARDTCAYDKDCVCNPDGTFIQNMPACLECGASLWQWYGSYLEPALALCEMQTTPNGYLPPCTETSESTASESVGASDEITSDGVSQTASVTDLTTDSAASSAAVESTGPTCGVNEGTPSFSCHSDCGNAIIYARDTCAYDKDCVCNPDGTFIQNMPACLECGASLWQWYGSYLEPALALCEMQTTPNGYLPPCTETSTENTESPSSESPDVESLSVSAPVTSSPTTPESASPVSSSPESSSTSSGTPEVVSIMELIKNAVLEAAFGPNASEQISAVIQKFVDAIGQVFDQLLAVLFNGNVILKRASSVEEAITAFTVFTSTLNQWFSDSSYAEFLQGVSEIHTYATPSEVEANVRSALESTLEAAQAVIDDFISQSKEFEAVSETFYVAFNKLVAEVIDALYPDSESSSSVEISPEASASAVASKSEAASVAESESVAASIAESESVAASIAESESAAASIAASESIPESVLESASAAASAAEYESAAASAAQSESAAASEGVSDTSSQVDIGTTTLTNTVTKYTTVVKTEGTTTTTVTEPCETTTETVVIEPTTTYTITETCSVCKTHTTVETGVTTVTKTSGTEVVTVTEPCETTYTVVESPVISESVVKTVTSTIVKTISSEEIPVTVTETCSVCKTHTTVETGVTTVTKTSGTDVVTVTEPCETTYTVIESPVTSESVVKTVTSTVVKTVPISTTSKESGIVTVTESCSTCKTLTTVETGVTTVTKTSGTEVVTVTEPCETTYTVVESPVVSKSTVSTVTSTVVKSASSSGTKASEITTVTEICSTCKTVTTVETGVTTVTKTSGTEVVTVTEPCETTYTVVESPVTSESVVKTITSTISKTVPASSAPEASGPVTVTEVCSDCKTQVTTATGTTTRTSVSEGVTVTATEPCETTYEVIESPVTSAGSTTIITLTSVITSELVTVTSSGTVVIPVPSGSATPVPSEGPSSHTHEGSSEGYQPTPTKSIQTIVQVPSASSTSPVIEQVNSGVSTSVHMLTLVLGVAAVFFM